MKIRKNKKIFELLTSFRLVLFIFQKYKAVQEVSFLEYLKYNSETNKAICPPIHELARYFALKTSVQSFVVVDAIVPHTHFQIHTQTNILVPIPRVRGYRTLRSRIQQGRSYS